MKPFPWKIGELAEATGVSVRALHHYEEIGILIPSQRGENDYRLYNESDVARLQQILSLKELGFTLEQIKKQLTKPDFSPMNLIERQLADLKQQATARALLQERLEGLMRFFKNKEDVSAEEFLKVIQAMAQMENVFTAEQQEEIRKRGVELGKEKIVEVENEWPQLMAKVKEEMNKGAKPKDPSVQKLAARWMELVKMFTGGNPEIEAKMRKQYEEKPDLMRTFGGPDPKMIQFIHQAIENLEKSP